MQGYDSLIKVDWIAIVEWPAYDMLGFLLGFASALFALLATLNSARAARAAEAARRAMAVDDAIADLTLVQQYLVETRLRAEAGQWDQASERCENIRTKLAPILTLDIAPISEDVRKGLLKMQSQIATLQKTSDGIRHNDEPADVAKIASVIGKQSEAIAVAIAEIRNRRDVPNN